MIDAKNTFERLCEAFPEVSAFKAPLREVYTVDSSAGKQIDLANTIFECTSKLAWSLLPGCPAEEKIEKSMAPKALQECKRYFEINDQDFYVDVWEALTKPAGRILGNRSEKGDVSHGHLPSKVEIGAPHATLSLNLALTFAAYFFAILENSSGKMRYDDYSEKDGFNEWLNRRGAKIGGAAFSWLIYQHDYDAYENFFDEFQYDPGQDDN